MGLAERVGYFLGRLVRESDGLDGLKKGLDRFFSELEEFHDFGFEYNYSKDVLITMSRCPIHEYFPLWCKLFCLEFAKGFARAYGVSEVRRLKTQPKEEFCVFEFRG